MIYGVWGGSATHLEPGGLTYEPSHMPHGESYERWKEATSADLQPQRVGEQCMAFMMHIRVMCRFLKYLESSKDVLNQITGKLKRLEGATCQRFIIIRL